MRAFLFAVVCFSSLSAQAADRFYMTIFGVQDRINRFETAHTFGLFVRVDDTAPEALETQLISWLPATGIVHLFARAEKGRNYPLDESLSEPAEDGRQITMWGPIEIKAELFERAKKRVADLESGRILYKAFDEFQRKTGLVTNCEHAVSDIDHDAGYLHTGTGHGNRGSRMVVRHLAKRWAIKPQVTHDWLIPRLHLDEYPIRREFLR